MSFTFLQQWLGQSHHILRNRILPKREAPANRSRRAAFGRAIEPLEGRLLLTTISPVELRKAYGIDQIKLGSAGLDGNGAGFHELRAVVTNLAVLDFQTPEHTLRLRSVHPGVSVSDVAAATGFPLVLPDEVPATRVPTAEELALIRRLDPAGQRERELG